MKNYRLKKEAVPFFKEDHATSIYSWDVWDKLQIDNSALEEVKPPYISCGIDKGGYKTLSGWNEKEGAKFEFTIFFPDITWQEHDRFSNGKLTRELMQKMQYVIDTHFYEFVNRPKTSNQ
jgi:hypothetical protein